MHWSAKRESISATLLLGLDISLLLVKAKRGIIVRVVKVYTEKQHRYEFLMYSTRPMMVKKKYIQTLRPSIGQPHRERSMNILILEWEGRGPICA